jgi:hypothetical protein
MQRTLLSVVGGILMLLLSTAPAWTQDDTTSQQPQEPEASGEAEASEEQPEEEPPEDEAAPQAETAAEEEPAFGFGLGIGVGTQTFEEDGSTEVYQSASLYPTFRYKKLSLGLDLTLNYTFTGGKNNNDFRIREEDWVPDKDQNVAELYLGKLRFLQYAEADEPLFVRLGSLDNVTLGNGFIMGGYTNTQFLPDRRLLGARLNVDGAVVRFPYFGFESMAANLAEFDVVGGRFYLRPLAGVESQVLSRLQLGSTLVADRNPDYHVDKLEKENRTGAALVYPDPGEVYVWGSDIRFPLLVNPPLTLATFADYVRQDEAQGGTTGIAGRIFRVVTYGGQIRFIGKNFVPVYFDAPYDLYRLEKYAVYKADTTLIEEHYGWFASAGLSLLEDVLVLRASMEGPIGAVKGAEEQVTGLLRLERGLVPNLSLEASYRKVDVDSPADLGDPEDSVIDARITYHTDPAAISLVYNLRYDPSVDDYVITSGLQSEITLR